MSLHCIHVQSRAVILHEGYILLCHTTGLAQNFYFLPGGHIEQGESAKNAMIREVMEELGVRCKIERFLGCMEYSFDPKKIQHAKCHTHEYTFIFEVSSDLLTKDQPPKQMEQHIEMHWIPLASLDDVDLRPKPLKRALPKWLELQLSDALESSME